MFCFHDRSVAWSFNLDYNCMFVTMSLKVLNIVNPRNFTGSWELHNLRQGTLSLEEFIARLRILLKEANYPVEHNERFLRNFLVLGMN